MEGAQQHAAAPALARRVRPQDAVGVVEAALAQGRQLSGADTRQQVDPCAAHRGTS
jgi:ABC-type enterobactin transport system permease subunit